MVADYAVGIDETERVLVPADGEGNCTTEPAGIYYIPTYDVLQYRWDDDGAGRMYRQAENSIWAAEKARESSYLTED
jgi:hypothetical protein